ncbi:hypothetical protein LTR85_008024 [Meristemomyces frigidus]|nr:hypothetical protein LTR85_008024 [Meristemomyces frigidus]
MAGMNIGTLIFELTALAPELNTAEELEDIIYNKLQDAADTEKAKIDAETRRLKKVFFAAKAGRPFQDNEALTPGLTVADNETNNVAMKLIALGNRYEGPHAEELRTLVRQLPRAAKAERAPAEAEIKRLQAAISALKAADAVQSPTQTAPAGSKEDDVAPKGAQRADHAPQEGKRIEAKKLEPPAPDAAGTQALQQQTDGDLRRRSSGHQSQVSASVPRAPAASRNLTDRHQLDGHPPRVSIPALQQPVASSVRTPHRQTPSTADTMRSSNSPSSDDRPKARDARLTARDASPGAGDHRRKRDSYVLRPSATVTPPAKRQRTLTTSMDCKLVCGRCKYYRLECNGMSRCQQCTGYCVYHPCINGDACSDRRCTMIHPNQWENTAEQYRVQGVNVHTLAPDSKRARTGQQ